MISDAEFAARMRAVRAYLDLTLAEAGAKLDYSPSHLSYLESADENGHQFRPRDRRGIISIYCELSGWSESFFTDDRPGSVTDPADLSPAEVVELVEREADGEDGAALS